MVQSIVGAKKCILKMYIFRFFTISQVDFKQLLQRAVGPLPPICVHTTVSKWCKNQENMFLNNFLTTSKKSQIGSKTIFKQVLSKIIKMLLKIILNKQMTEQLSFEVNLKFKDANVNDLQCQFPQFWRNSFIYVFPQIQRISPKLEKYFLQNVLFCLQCKICQLNFVNCYIFL